MKLKQLFPNHVLRDKQDYEIQQFTANDMIEFAELVAREALKNASENSEATLDEVYEGGLIMYRKIAVVVPESILPENNIPKL